MKNERVKSMNLVKLLTPRELRGWSVISRELLEWANDSRILKWVVWTSFYLLKGGQPPQAVPWEPINSYTYMIFYFLFFPLNTDTVTYPCNSLKLQRTSILRGNNDYQPNYLSILMMTSRAKAISLTKWWQKCCTGWPLGSC
jgi:hypothetical protein